MTKIKRCPFCGGRASVYVSAKYTKSRLYYIECDNYECTINPISGFYDDEDEAIKAWNTRTERTCHNTNEYKRLFTCSECGETEYEGSHPNYCPHCGSKVINDRSEDEC